MKQLLYIDLFCGAGGTSTGVERARIGGKKCARVIACVNHDPNAIKSHAANHPRTKHFTEDIRTLDMKPLQTITDKERAKNPGAKVVLWASLECTNFSKAKGGKPRDADSRTMAEHLFRYIDALQPDYIYIENVEEFMCWGDLDENGKPISRDEGRLYLKWVSNVEKRGYKFDHQLLNAANYGARTSRKRFFGIFAKGSLPIAWPEPTHCKNGRKADMFHPALKPWEPCSSALDLQVEGESIFTRKKPLVERSLERIYEGLIKQIAGGKEAFLIKYNSYSKSGNYIAPGIDEPCHTVAVQNRLGIAKVQFLSKQFSGDPKSKNQSIDKPLGSITCKDHHTIVSVKFLDQYRGNGYAHSINEPTPTLPPKDNLSLITSHFFANEYSGGGQIGDINAPSPGITCTPKIKLVTVEQSQFLVNPQFASKGGSINDPCFTLIARMDKMPPYLVTINQEQCIGIVIYERDTPAMRKIKEFMAIYDIVDIKMRMLSVNELKRIMGFGDDYTLIGTQTEQKKFIGNAVECHMSQVLCEALANELNR